jgi:triosephosphate isomerase
MSKYSAVGFEPGRAGRVCSGFERIHRQVSAVYAQNFGCRYAIVGHSERRQYHAETDALAEEAGAALAASVTPIVCVGETLAERDWPELKSSSASGGRDQCQRALHQRGGGCLYEPVWAIGTGKTASPAQAVHAVLRGSS